MVKKKKVQFGADVVTDVQKGIADLEAAIDEGLRPIRDIYNGICAETPLDLGGEKVRICNQLADILEPRRKVSVLHLVGIFLVGLAVILDLLDALWLLAGWIPFVGLLNVGASIIVTITLTYWLGPIGLLYGWEVIVDILALIFLTVGGILYLMALLPTSIILIATWWILFRRTGKFVRQPITVSRACRV